MSAQLADDELLITRTFDAPASVLFALWTQGEHMKNWMGPQGFECPYAEIDARVGGAYRGMIKSPETGDSWFGGVFREIVPDRKLVFTFAWDTGPSGEVETLVTITFNEHDGKTTQTFHQTPFISVDRRDAHVGGWNGAFEREAAYAARLVQIQGSRS